MEYADLIHERKPYARWLQATYQQETLAYRVVDYIENSGITVNYGFVGGIADMFSEALAWFLAVNEDFGADKPENRDWREWCREHSDDSGDTHPSLTVDELQGGAKL